MSSPTPINTNRSNVRFVADGIITEFCFNFVFFEPQDIQVFFGANLQTGGYEVTQSENSDGGSVVFANPPAAGVIVTIARNLEIKRTTSFSESKAFRSKMLNHEFDYQVACLEQISDGIQRNLSIPVYGDSGAIPVLPLPEPGKAILWNAEGTALINSQIDVETLDSATAQCIQAASAAEAAISAIQSGANDAQSAISAAEAAASQAMDAATQAMNTAATVANKAANDLSNVSSDSVKALAGTRFYDSGNIDIIFNSMTVGNHGLNITDILDRDKCICKIDLINQTAANGYTKNDFVGSWGIYASSGTAAIPVALRSFVFTGTQWRLPVSSAIYLINQSSYAYESIVAANYKFRIRIWY